MSCKHIAALCYALEEFKKSDTDSRIPSIYTDKLQTWNQPRLRKLDLMPVESRRSCHLENGQLSLHV